MICTSLVSSTKMAQPYYISGCNDNLDEGGSMYFSQQNDHKTRPSDTLPGVYDLAGQNVQGVYDLSQPSKPKLPPKSSKPTAGARTNNAAHEWNKIRDPTELKHWILIHRRKLLVTLVIIALVSVAIGVLLALLHENKTKGSNQNTTTFNAQGN